MKGRESDGGAKRCRPDAGVPWDLIGVPLGLCSLLYREFELEPKIEVS